MTRVTLIDGDLFKDNSADAIVNAVNCQGVMGGGIALAFKNRYPFYYYDYKTKCKYGRIMMGRVDPYALYLKTADAPRMIFSFPTMLEPGTASELVWIDKAMADLIHNCTFFGIRVVGMPALGCGIGGLNTQDVIDIAHKHFDNTGVSCEFFLPL